MPIHPILAPGLDAFRRRDYLMAAAAWEDVRRDLDGDDRELVLALVRLAEALHQEAVHRDASAGRLFALARRGLEALPTAVLGLGVARLRRELPATAEAAVAAPPSLAPAPRVPRRALLRFALLVVLLIVGFAALRWTPLADYFTREALVAAFDRLSRSPWAPAAFIALYAGLCPLGVPVTPLVVAGGLVFGVVWGAIYNFLGTLLGAATTYGLGRLLGREFVSHLLGGRLRRVERFFARTRFWTVVRIRFVPIPFPLVNYGAALSGVPAPLFLGATALGLAPSIFLFTYFAALLIRAAAEGERRGPVVAQAAIAFGLVFLLTFLPKVLEGRRRRRRYRELLERRRARGAARNAP